MSYTPPFTITENILNLVAEIAEKIGRLNIHDSEALHPLLRKENRIKTIHASLAIENNSLSLEQITAILDGKHVIGSPVEIKEVKNAIDAYNLLQQINPFSQKDLLSSHKLMMSDLVERNGKYRNSGVGVFDGTKVVHMAPPADMVPFLMADLFEWLSKSDTHILIKSCVFHYEFEFIHPFEDGNGRMGRLWQTAILMKWNPIFAWLPIETLIKENQQEYYEVLSKCDKTGSSTLFIELLLKLILDTINENITTQKMSNKMSSKMSDKMTNRLDKIILFLKQNDSITTKQAALLLECESKTAQRILQKGVEENILDFSGENKGRIYFIKKLTPHEE